MLISMPGYLWKYRNVLIRGVRNHLNSSCDTLLLDLHSPANPRKQFDNFSTKQTKKDLLSCLEPGPEMLERFRYIHRLGTMDRLYLTWTMFWISEAILWSRRYLILQQNLAWEILYQSDRGKKQYSFILIWRRFSSLFRQRYVKSSAVWTA